MNKRSFLKTINGVQISPVIQTGTDGINLRSVKGPIDGMGRAIEQLQDREFDPGTLLAIGFGVNGNGETRVHMILLDINPSVNVVQARAKIDKSQVMSLRQPGYSYANKLGTAQIGKGESHIRLAAWGRDFQDQPNAEEVFNLGFDLFNEDGTVKGAKDKDARTILLIGGDGERVTLASKPGEACKALPSTDFETERHTLVGQTLLVGEYGGKRIYGMQAETIAAYLDGTTLKGDFQWKETQIDVVDGTLVEMAVVDGAQHSTVLTMQDGKFAYVPAAIRWNAKGELGITIDASKSVTTAMVGKGYQPIVRISAQKPSGKDTTAAPRFNVTSVDQNGGRDVLRYQDGTDLTPAFATTAQTAAKDQLYSGATGF